MKKEPQGISEDLICENFSGADSSTNSGAKKGKKYLLNMQEIFERGDTSFVINL